MITSQAVMEPPQNPNWNPQKPACREEEVFDGCRTVENLAAHGYHAARNFTDAQFDERLEDYHLSDLITSLLHLCDREGFDRDKVLERATRAHEEEA